jgi:hypothetical protein
MKFAVWFAQGYANAELLSKHDDFTAAVTAANRAASTGSEDIEVINAQGQAIYKIGFTSLNEFVEMN